MRTPRQPRRHRRLVAVASVALLSLAAAACEPEPGPPPAGAPRAVVTDLDTFSVSNQPTARRGGEPLLRVMDSAGKSKVAFVSFPVRLADTSRLSATLAIVPRQTGFVLEVHNAGSFSNDTTHVTRPPVATQVGSLGRTLADSRQQIALRDVRVVGGRVHLAITTSSPYELEVVSFEGAQAAGRPDLAPTFTPEVTGPTTPPPPPAPAPRGWDLTFADEFNGTAVDTSRWNVYEQRDGDTVESPKSSTCPRSDNVSVGGGKLVMRTEKANGGCLGGQAQSGAGMNTWGTFRQAGGRFVARGRWTDRGNYLWGGFWTAGLGSRGDTATEIDTWEYIGKVAEPNISRYKPAIHYNYTCEGTCGMQNLQQLDYDVTAWHEYAVEWEPTNPADPTTMQIRFYLDGMQIAQFDKHGTWRVTPSGTKVLEIPGGWRNPRGAFPNPFGLDRPHNLVLSAWVGAPGVSAADVAAGYRPAAGHADLEIDYVRVYSR